MKVRKIIKRLLAVGAGATMLGATVMSAMGAANLNTYPTMFVTEGKFNGYFVVGEKAAAVDNLAMTDISTSMKYNKPADKATTTVTGDAWKVGTASKWFEMSPSNTSTSTIGDAGFGGENFNSIVTYISKDELKALASGTYTTGTKDANYNQYLYFDSTTTTNENVKFVENDNEKTADFLYFKNGDVITRYKLEFTSNAETDVTDSAGSADTSGTYLNDFENTKLTMLGQTYDVVMARRPAANEDGVKLVLMTGAVKDTLLEGEEKTYTAAGKEYKVKLTYVDATYAKFVVNGAATDKIAVGETKKTSDGKEMGVSELLYQSYAGGVHSATFFLGANKIELKDTHIATAGSSNDVIVGSDDKDGAAVTITGTDNNVTVRVSSIEVNITAQDDYYVPANGKLSDIIAAAGDEKEILFTNNWDVEYKGLSTETTHDIKLDTSSDKRYHLTFYDGDNKKVELPVAYAEAQYHLSFGDEANSNAAGNRKETMLNEYKNLSKDDYFVVTGGTTNTGNAKSYVLQYKGSDDLDKTSPKIKFKNIGNQETLEYSAASSNPRATIKVGGYSFIVQNVSSVTANDDWTINVDMNGDGAYTTGSNVVINDYYGARIILADLINGSSAPNASTQDHINITIDTPNSDDFDNIMPDAMKLEITSDSTIEVSSELYWPAVRTSTNNLITPEGESEVTYGYTAMGTKVTLKSPTGGPEQFTYVYPEHQILPQVYFTSGATATSTSTAGDLAAVTIVDATKLDSEITDVTAQNLIVVGGPCVNTVAATLMGNPANCADGFNPGKARVKLFEHATGKVAMLIAGYSGEDTRLAGKVIAHRYKEMSGTEVEIEGTTTTDATIGAPKPVEVAPVVVEETPVVATQ